VQQQKKFRDAIFVITEERSCPIYNIGEELKVEDLCAILPEAKSICMILVEKLIGITKEQKSFERFSQFGVQKSKFDCGGCEGFINFEYKKKKEFSTLQMKLLSEAEERRRKKHLDKFYSKLRNFPLFESLDDGALYDLAELLELKTYPKDKIVLKKGDPGAHLFVLLSGKVGVIGDDGQRLAEMGQGEIFGEMSLLSGEPVSCSIHSLSETEAALLSIKNFKHVLKKYPVLQLFLLKMLVDRAQAMALRSGNITSGMSGELDEISIVELLQLINSSQKTGIVELLFDDARATVLFSEGELMQVRYKDRMDKEALFELLGKKTGHFTYTKGIPLEFENREPFGSFMGLIMEGVQFIDEQEYGES
jgi:CRP/FNR family transcriptional regulator, cyclic AMP receptor protein